MLLSIETIDGLTTIMLPGRRDVWVFPDGGQAMTFIDAWFAEDIRGIINARENEAI